MKKIFSLLLVAVLTISLAAPAFATTGGGTVISTSSSSAIAGSIGISGSGSSSGSTSVFYSYAPRFGSRGPVFPTYKYAGTIGKIENLPVRISGFSLSSKYVTVRVGAQSFSVPVTHKRSGGKWESTIGFLDEDYDRTVNYGFGSAYTLRNAYVDMRIIVKHYGSSVSAHTVRTNGNCTIGSNFKFQIWDETVARANSMQSSTATVTTSIRGSTSKGYFKTDVFFAAKGTRTLSYSETQLVAMNERMEEGTPAKIATTRYYSGGWLKEYEMALSYNDPNYSPTF